MDEIDCFTSRYHFLIDRQYNDDPSRPHIIFHQHNPIVLLRTFQRCRSMVDGIINRVSWVHHLIYNKIRHGIHRQCHMVFNQHRKLNESIKHDNKFSITHYHFFSSLIFRSSRSMGPMTNSHLSTSKGQANPFSFLPSTGTSQNGSAMRRAPMSNNFLSSNNGPSSASPLINNGDLGQNFPPMNVN